MKNIDSMYENIFNEDKYDKMFETFQVENNPVLEPIDEMSKQIFETQPEQGPKYVKVEPKER